MKTRPGRLHVDSVCPAWQLMTPLRLTRRRSFGHDWNIARCLGRPFWAQPHVPEGVRSLRNLVSRPFSFPALVCLEQLTGVNCWSIYWVVRPPARLGVSLIPRRFFLPPPVTGTVYPFCLGPFVTCAGASGGDFYFKVAHGGVLEILQKASPAWRSRTPRRPSPTASYTFHAGSRRQHAYRV